MIEKEAKFTKETLDLLDLSASISAAIIETFEEKNIISSHRFFVIKNILLIMFKDYENWTELADFFFKDVRETMGRMEDYKSKGTTTLK